MARIRTVKPSFFRSRAVRRLSSNDVRLLWVGLWPLADDSGRLLDEPTQLVGDLWALEMNADRIDAALTELHEAGRIIRYDVDGERFIQITNWSDHQRIQKPTPSEIPPAPVAEHSGSATGTVSGGREGKGRGREGNARALTPFCEQHPQGIDAPCRACGNARRAFDLAATAERSKPTVSGIVTPPDCARHPYYPAHDCAKCAEEMAA